jgi:predicted dehydrogenase
MTSRATSERVKVGIVGGGAITQVAHLPVLKKVKTIEVRAICDTDLPKARALADRFAVKDAFDDIEELLRYEELDAVVICSPNHLHEAHILAALSANLHVLVEKPLAMTAASAARIVEAAEKRGRVVMVGMNHRYRPDVQIVRSFVQSGELGPWRACAGAGTCSGPVARCSAGGNGGSNRAAAPCSISASRSSISDYGSAAIPSPAG